SEEHTSELQSLTNLVCRLLLEKKKKTSSRETTKSKLHEEVYPQLKLNNLVYLSCTTIARLHPHKITARPQRSASIYRAALAMSSAFFGRRHTGWLCLWLYLQCGCYSIYIRTYLLLSYFCAPLLLF